MRVTPAARCLLAAAVAASLAMSAAGGARAQGFEDTTTSTSTSTSPPTAPETTSTSTSITGPRPDETAATTTSPATSPATTTTRPATTTVTTPPAGGGDAPLPPGATPVIPPDMLARINSVRRSGPNSTVRLVEALAPLVAMGMSEKEAVQAGFGRFPVGGRATFTDDWWFPRFVPTLHLHEGTDIFAPYGTPARAPADGTLKQTVSPVGGFSVYVTEPNGTYYYLAHLSRFEAGQVSGQAVRTGDVVGYVGDSGNARGTSPHVHFEVRPGGGGPTNPKPLLDAWLRAAVEAAPAVVGAAGTTLAGQAPQAGAEEQDLAVVGHTDLGGAGGYGDVAVVGATALVATGDGSPRPVPAGTEGAPALPPTCAASVAVVDLGDPAAPVVAAAIAVAPGRRVEDLDALAVRAPAFTGTVVAVVEGPCAPGDGGTAAAFYDVTDAAAPRLLGRVALPRQLADAGAAGCGPPLRGTCARTDRTVELQSRPDGRVVSLSSAPGAPGVASEVFAVDLTDVEAPRALGFVPLGQPDQEPAVDAGCAPVRLPAPRRPAAGRLGGLFDITGSSLAPDAGRADALLLDAAAAYSAVADAGGRRLAVVTEGSWWSSTWALRVAPPAVAAGEKPGCSGPVSTAPDGAGPTAGELVYVGRGCPGRKDADGADIPPDPYVSDPAGRIAVADAALAPGQRPLSGQGCAAAARRARARQAGALGLVVAGSFLADAVATATAAGDGATAADDGVTPPAGPGGAIPAVLLRKPDGDAVRDALCPPTDDPASPCGARPGPVSGEVVELPGVWSGLRLLDVTDPSAPRRIGVYRPAAAQSSPDPAASYAVEAAVADGSRVYAAWGGAGLRVVDLASGTPVEVASFAPPSPAADPAATPAPTHVAGVDYSGDYIVVSDRTSGLWVLDKRPPAGTRGYWLADAAGGVRAFGDASVYGSAEGLGLTGPVTAMAPTPTGGGYWLVTAEGGVYAFGDAAFEGSLAGAGTAPIVGIAATPSGAGYWLVSAAGGVYAFGDATFFGSLGAGPPARPIVALAATPSGRGYRLVGADGGVFAFGDADFLGSMAATPPSAPVVGAAGTASGRGYWLVSADGGVFAFGDARFKGSVSGRPVASPIVGVAAMAGVKGYWMAAAAGGVDALGTPPLGGRPRGTTPLPPVAAIAAVPRPPAAWRPPAEISMRQTPPGVRPAQ